MSGRVVHFEIPFDDGERARTFYREAFGWNIQQMPEMDYTTVSSGPTSEQGMPTEPGFINGGMFERDAAWSTTPVITLDVDDIDAALETIKKLGGSAAVDKTTVGDMGFSAYFKDSEGNIMGLWQNA
ncbi:VOC family protein [Arthrobacter sp. H5]|uniref:VOC family protein n=1 Tax=Arthrobacter sp. H5 TaxID=1267973 RepID=UPI0004869311|nr:VOC family protein [Arthrobacter sp. H5]